MVIYEDQLNSQSRKSSANEFLNDIPFGKFLAAFLPAETISSGDGVSNLKGAVKST